MKTTLLFILFLLTSCASNPPAPVQEPSAPPTEFAVITFFNTEEASRALVEWEDQGIAYEVRRYDTDIDSGFFKFNIEKSLYNYLTNEKVAGRILHFEMSGVPDIEWAPDEE